jgi:recombination protein RecA
MKLSEKPSYVDRVSSGSLTLDAALGGGLPKGRIIEIYGPESSGKTTLAMAAVAEVHRVGGQAMLFDAEHAYNAEYCKRMGVDKERLHIAQESCGEDTLEMVDMAVRSSVVDLVVVDSVAALTPRAELEGEMGDKLMGAQARMMSQAMRKIAGNASKSNCIVIFINQLRQKIGVVYGNPEVTTGGNALKYYCSVRIDVRRKEYIHPGGKKEAEALGIRVKAKVVKNKVAPPHRVAEFDLMFNEGISKPHGLVDAAEKVKVISRKGAWYSYNEQNIGQGRDKTVAALKADPALAEEIEAKTRELMTKLSDPDSEIDILPDVIEEGEDEPPLELDDGLADDISSDDALEFGKP